MLYIATYNHEYFARDHPDNDDGVQYISHPLHLPSSLARLLQEMTDSRCSCESNIGVSEEILLASFVALGHQPLDTLLLGI